MTGEQEYQNNGDTLVEPRATFASMRFKRHILDNSAVGILFVGKQTPTDDFGVLDIDGAFRTSLWQLSYQLARSFKNNEGDFGGSAGFTMLGESWLTFVRSRYIGEKFDVDAVGYVPWRGTAEFTAISGPRWYFEGGYTRSILLYGGPALNHEKIDGYTDHSFVLGYNMQFRTNWGFEVNLVAGSSRDGGVEYGSSEVSLSSWFNPVPTFNGNLWGGYSKTYNFRRGYRGFYGWSGAYVSYQVLPTLQMGTSMDAFLEQRPDHSLEDFTFNARPFGSWTPVNDLNIRLYVDGLYVRSSDKLEQTIVGLLFSYNFLPKSWLYFALNEVRDRPYEYDAFGSLMPRRLQVADRAGVIKLKYLYYF